MRGRRLLVAIAAGAFVIGPVSAAVATTAPSTTATVFVLINDRGIEVSAYQETMKDNSPTLGMMRGGLPRGELLHFDVVNRGKKAHDFTIFGKKTRVLKPGQRAKFRVIATTRGHFPYKSTLDRGKQFRGFLHIY